MIAAMKPDPAPGNQTAVVAGFIWLNALHLKATAEPEK